MLKSRARLPEPILTETDDKYITRDKYKWIKKRFNAQRAANWEVKEINLSQDYIDARSDKIPLEVRKMVKRFHALFMVMDGIVAENINVNFCHKIQIAEIRFIYAQQNSIEAVHQLTYQKIARTLCEKPEEFEELCRAHREDPGVKAKAEWAKSWTSEDRLFEEQIVAFACIEGIFFFSTFAGIDWIKKRGWFPGVCQANDLIRSDETEHVKTAAEIVYYLLVNKLSVEKFHEIIASSVEVEKLFVRNLFANFDILGLNAKLMERYVEYVADYVCKLFSYPAYYKAVNPFDWLDAQSIEGKTNFFERSETKYIVGATMPNIFSTTEAF